MFFKNFAERNKPRKPEPFCKFANKFLDDALGGIYPDDLVVITAKTGAGKTEMVSQIAQINALEGKHVHMFALEAYHGEIEERIIFRLIAKEYFSNSTRRGQKAPRFQDWVQGKQGFLNEFEAIVRPLANKSFKTLNTFYREKDFNITHFEGIVGQIEDKTDLVIVDHLHHFDLESGDDVRELKLTIKKIRDLMLFYRKPTVLVVHIRKIDRRSVSLTPELEDIHGSSEISKVATKIIAAAPAYDMAESTPGVYSTYFRILKNRQDGSVTRYIAVCNFDSKTNSYLDDYLLGLYSPFEDEFKSILDLDFPSWATKKTWEEQFAKQI